MLRLEERDGVTVVRMEHGAVNAMDTEFCRALATTFTELGSGGHRAVVVTGNGRAFSAGVDLRRLLADAADYVEEFIPALIDGFEAVFGCPIPVVAAIEGPAIAGGCIVACAADERLLAAERGRIGVTEVLVGVPFPPTPLEIVRFAVGGAWTNELVLTGTIHGGEEALRRRLVDAVVPDDEVLDRALAAARRLAAIPPATFRLTKELLRAPTAERIAAHRARFDDGVRAAWASPEVRAAVEDFAARTFGPR